MVAIKFEKSFAVQGGGGFGWVTKTLSTQNEANAFTLWNNNLGYQGILELDIENALVHLFIVFLIDGREFLWPKSW
jgi:hypothetical protein